MPTSLFPNRPSLIDFSRKFLVGVLCVFISLFSAARAQNSEALGRLFFSPEHRQALDRQRRSDVMEKEDALESVAGLTINGFVLRSSGRRSLWINGQSYNETSREILFSTDAKDPARITVYSGQAPMGSVKVGDTLFRGTGEVNSLLQGGTFTTNTANTTNTPNNRQTP